MRAFCIPSQLYYKSKTNLKSKIYSKTIIELITSFKPLTKAHRQRRAVGRVYSKHPSFFKVQLQKDNMQARQSTNHMNRLWHRVFIACQCICGNLVTLENAGFWAELYINHHHTVILALNWNIQCLLGSIYQCPVYLGLNQLVSVERPDEIIPSWLLLSSHGLIWGQ